MESLLGAVYLEVGYPAVEKLILDRWQALIDERAEAPGERDFKTRLQEVLAQDGRRPIYAVSEEGPEHAKRFTATVSVDGTILGRGSGTSKKRAEQQAAEMAASALNHGDA